MCCKLNTDHDLNVHLYVSYLLLSSQPLQGGGLYKLISSQRRKVRSGRRHSGESTLNEWLR